jgi:periplasmic protein TonB
MNMVLRCLLFTSDEGTASPVLQVLADLSVEGEHCADAVATVEKATHQNFHIVIIDWDQQPEAGLLLTAARQRKAADRPLTLAIVSNDASVPQALQAGANSILRKPILLTQVKDTLTTACDLLRSKQESAATVAQAAAAGVSAGSIAALPANGQPGSQKTLRTGEFLQTAGTVPGGQFETDSDVHEASGPSSAEPVDALKDLEPMAAPMDEDTPASPASAPPGEFRGLEWHLKARGVAAPAAPARPAQPPAPGKPELLGFAQTPAFSPASPASADDSSQWAPTPAAKPTQTLAQEQRHEQKKEAELFAYTSGESSESDEAARPRSSFKGAIVGAMVLAAFAIAVAPQAPWHPKLLVAWAHGKQTFHIWLNPQPVTTPQAPAAHEDFGRAGDEYKLPVAESIPDATTDPSQIQVLPVVDPTAKKANSSSANAEQPPAESTGTAAGDPTPAPGVQASPVETTQPASGTATGGTTLSNPTPSPAPPVAVPTPVAPPRSDPPAAVPSATASVSYTPVQPATPVPPAPQKSPQPHYARPPGNVPSSLKSQMASMTPDASGNKPADAAMQSIEPVAVSEASERLLLTDQPRLDYPASARGQQGTVVLQVLIGRDGTVQDAKFMQGSLAFARTAIEGVKLWKFKPYVMNGRPVSVQTTMTIILKP